MYRLLICRDCKFDSDEVLKQFSRGKKCGTLKFSNRSAEHDYHVLTNTISPAQLLFWPFFNLDFLTLTVFMY